MDLNETVCVRSAHDKQRIFIFDSTNQPNEVNLTSFGKAEITFGRDPANDITLISRLVSRYHGKFVCENGQWKVVDLGSTNGLICNDEEKAELPVVEDSYVRIDDGIETVADGVLVIFPSENYSEDWNPIRMAGNKILLNVIEPLIGSYIEHVGDSFYLNLSKSASNVRINHRQTQGRTKLHEKDLIETAGYRIVFTSTILYYNRLQEQDRMSSAYFRQAQPFKAGNQRYDRAEAFAGAAFRNSEAAQSAPPVHTEYTHESRAANQAAQGCDERPPSKLEKDSNTVSTSESGVKSFLASTGGYYLMVIVFALVIWGIAVFLWTSQSEIAIVVMLACAYFGWNALNNIQPAMFIWMPWVGWIVYVIVKFILSAIIGLFVAPFKIGRWIADMVSSSAQ